MTKYEFLFALHEKLKGLPEAEVEDRLRFYVEMIEDRMESGLSEEEAVAAAGSVEQIAAQIAEDIGCPVPEDKPAEPTKPAKPKKKAGEIVLLAMGSPLWFPLLIAAFAVGLSLYLSLWAVIISLWSVFASLIACGVAGILGGLVMVFCGKGSAGFALLAAGLVCTGLSIFAFFGCKAVTNGTALLTKKFTLWLKGHFSRKEDAPC